VGFAQRFSAQASGPARLLAFSLDGRAVLPPLPAKREPIREPPAAEPEPALALQGKAIWDANGCELCHGFQVVGGMGSVPDLRRISAPHYEVFSLIVRGGLFKATGMPIFADSIREEDLPALKAYLIGEAWKGYRADQAANAGH
jgi:quinohemoprotein ethanol dehydrogenase